MFKKLVKEIAKNELVAFNKTYNPNNSFYLYYEATDLYNALYEKNKNFMENLIWLRYNVLHKNRCENTIYELLEEVYLKKKVSDFEKVKFVMYYDRTDLILKDFKLHKMLVDKYDFIKHYLEYGTTDITKLSDIQKVQLYLFYKLDNCAYGYDLSSFDIDDVIHNLDSEEFGFAIKSFVLNKTFKYFNSEKLLNMDNKYVMDWILDLLKDYIFYNPSEFFRNYNEFDIEFIEKYNINLKNFYNYNVTNVDFIKTLFLHGCTTFTSNQIKTLIDLGLVENKLQNILKYLIRGSYINIELPFEKYSDLKLVTCSSYDITNADKIKLINLCKNQKELEELLCIFEYNFNISFSDINDKVKSLLLNFIIDINKEKYLKFNSNLKKNVVKFCLYLIKYANDVYLITMLYLVLKDELCANYYTIVSDSQYIFKSPQITQKIRQFGN